MKQDQLKDILSYVFWVIFKDDSITNEPATLNEREKLKF